MSSIRETTRSASGLPTGTVTFLFSDIEGSTQRWERDPAAMQDAVRRHDVLMRSAIEANGGHVFKTIGDAFCAAFARPEQAMAAALDAQRALCTEDFSAVDGVRVRMALHAGTADERDADYFGPAVNRVARLLAIGHGGQVLVSGVTADLVQGTMPPQSSVRELGAHRLKDLARPEHVYQLVAPDLPEAFPALRSLDELPNNLPAQLTSFVGRDAEVREIKSLLHDNRLVTLVGTGGAGKTRCAEQLGAEMLDGSGDGVWLIELAPTSDPSLVANAVAQALSVQESPRRPMLETLLAYLKRKRLLLIIDNCEHVIDGARNVVAAILRGCPDVHVLATSREGLNVAGEHVYRMPSLSMPPAGEALTADAARAYGATALFADRALASSGRFTFTDDDAPYVAEICRRLDGIPLAIELAAARIKLLSPKQLLQKLDERFRVLTGGDRSALPRQQTMRALIDWSYDLLGDDERALFRKLAIFAGGFTLETASAIGASDTLDELAVLDLLSSLVDKSLVQAEPVGSGTRYRLLESTRHYAREKLVADGQEVATANIHAATYLALAQELDRAFQTTPDRAWIARAEPELENWRAALEWTLCAKGDAPVGQRLAGALSGVWRRFARAEGRRWVELALQGVTDATPPAVVAKLDLTQAHLESSFHRYKAGYAAAQRALARYQDLADLPAIVEAMDRAGFALSLDGRPAEGETLLRAALDIARRLDAPFLMARVLRSLGAARYRANDLAGARPLFAEALALLKAVGAERTLGEVAIHLAEAAFRGGDALEALRASDDALASYRAFRDEHATAIVLSNMAAYLLVLGRQEEAMTYAREALAPLRDARDEVAIAHTLQHAAAAFALREANPAPHPRADVHERGDSRAARLLGYVDARLTTLDVVREYTEQQEHDTLLAVLHDALGETDCVKLMDEGRAWTEDQALEVALLA